jgi:hypothetical protein
MSTLGRSIIFLMIFPSSAVYSSPSSAQPGKAQPQTPAPTSRTRMDGKFGHYLVTPTGAIDGIVLEDGTIARFPLFEPVPQTAFLRPGDTVHVEGDGLSGPTGPVLLNASVEKRSDVAVVADKTPAPSSTGNGSPPRSHRGRKRGPSPNKGLGSPSAVAEGKMQDPSEDRSANGSFFFGNTNISARKKRPEGIWLKLRHMTTGTDHVGDDSRWQRFEETSGP